MQLELEIVPVLIGSAAFLLYNRFCSKLALRKPKKEDKKDEAAVEKCGKLADEVALDDIVEQDEPVGEPSPEPVPEPVPEPSPSSEELVVEEQILPAKADTPQRRHARPVSFTLAALMAVLVAALIALEEEPVLPAGLSPPAGGSVLQPPVTAPSSSVQGGSNREDGSELEPAAAPPAPVAGFPQAISPSGAAVPATAPATATVPHPAVPMPAPAEEEPVSSGHNSLTVKLTRQVVGQEAGDDFVRSAYYGTLMVGTPPEPFTVVFDTGSGHLILPSTYCRSETCKAHKRFRRTASSTANDINCNGNVVAAGQMRDQISVSFGTGDVTGVFVEDIVCVDGIAGDEAAGEGAVATGSLTDPFMSEGMVVSGENGEPALRPGCVKLRLIAATELSEEPFKDFQFDGILGLGLDGLSQTAEFNFLKVVAESVREWGGDNPQTFAVFLADNEKEDSEIELGGWAPNHLVEDLSWGSVLEPEMGHWILPIKGLRVDGEKLNFCEEGCKAAVDTGTSLLAVPTAAFPELYDMLKRPAPPAGHCQGAGPLLHIEFEEFSVTLGPKDYARLEPAATVRSRPRLREDAATPPPPAKPSRRDLRCLPTLMTLDLPEPLGPKLFILGEPVLRKYYTVYDGQRLRVGFGRARHRQAPTRDDLILMAAGGVGGLPPPQRARPTMFDVFRWRRALQ